MNDATVGRPLRARFVRAACLFELVLLAGLGTWRSVATDAPWRLWAPTLCTIAFIGLWRRVAWGRSLFSVVSVLLSLAASASFLPDLDDPFYAGLTLTHWLERLPLMLWWAIVVVATTLPLLPAVALGRCWQGLHAARW